MWRWVAVAARRFMAGLCGEFFGDGWGVFSCVWYGNANESAPVITRHKNTHHMYYTYTTYVEKQQVYNSKTIVDWFCLCVLRKSARRRYETSNYTSALWLIMRALPIYASPPAQCGGGGGGGCVAYKSILNDMSIDERTLECTRYIGKIANRVEIDCLVESNKKKQSISSRFTLQYECEFRMLFRT